jgi:CBS domain-containing protein
MAPRVALDDIELTYAIMGASMNVRSLISQRPLLKATPDTTVARAAKLMGLKRVGAIAIVQDQKLVGIFTDRDALVRVIAQDRDPQTTPLREVMTREPRTIGPDEPVESALTVMQRDGLRHLPVVENAELIGIFSSSDDLAGIAPH